ncbi:hypothetical protein AYK24_08250 [Thermoplasmatales archaeon SG8-52-4]|nr:MAG: hypothetical protein AYK24_08250 [Thermoplasmatales archaeon SG8-52-4]
MKKILIFSIIVLLILSGIGAGGFSQKVISKEKNAADYDMVIIAPNAFSSQVQPLIDHKVSYGVQTFLKTTEDIYSEFSGRDDPEKIKYFIKSSLENNSIKYVLLLGGLIDNTKEWYVPVRYVELDDGTGQGKFFISDLYYADIYKNGDEFEDWDSNGDGIIAQWPKDKFDLYPDVCIGRLPCRTTGEVTTVVGKIISYETNTNGQPWFENMVVIGGDTFPAYDGYEGEITCDYAADYMTDFNITKLYYSLGTLTSSAEVKNAINSGCGFLFTRAKGGTDRIRVPRSDGTEIIALHNDDVDKLTNKDKYPVMVLGECIHGKFDMVKKKAKVFYSVMLKILNFLKELFIKITGKSNPENNAEPAAVLNECIAWKLVNKKDGGGIAVLTNTHICYAAIGDNNLNEIPDDVEIYGGFLAVEIFRLYSQEEIDILGDLHCNTIINYIPGNPVNTDKFHCKSVLEWILIGDPSLKVGGY